MRKTESMKLLVKYRLEIMILIIPIYSIWDINKWWRVKFTTCKLILVLIMTLWSNRDMVKCMEVPRRITTRHGILSFRSSRRSKERKQCANSRPPVELAENWSSIKRNKEVLSPNLFQSIKFLNNNQRIQRHIPVNTIETCRWAPAWTKMWLKTLVEYKTRSSRWNNLFNSMRCDHLI